mmetsp:Transcript_23109/g.26820  ORF Transcript_23109/g.26820 Transcript_23109/m.26820 type:complete len:393 (+) Transcript_23109:26-1204(+)
MSFKSACGAILLGAIAVGGYTVQQCVASSKSAPSPSTPSSLTQASHADDISLNPIALFGLPSDSNIFVAKGYISSLNLERRIPNWVVERVMYQPPAPKGSKSKVGSSDDDGEGASAAAVSRTDCKFFPEKSLPEMFQVQNADYNRRGLSRGHMAPAQFHKASQEEMNETFNLNANVVPQDMTMNACDWYRLESMTKKLSKEFPKGLWVLSGPLFVPQYEGSSGKRVVRYEVIGDRDVAVPSHLFKCLLGVADDERKYLSCFAMPNEPIPEERPMIQYQVAPSYISRVTGLRIFPKACEAADAAGGSFFSSLGSAMTPPTDMCRKFKCEGSYATFGKSFRNIGRVRAATTEADVKRVYMELFQAGQIDSGVEKELKAKLSELGVKNTSAYGIS